MRKDKKFIVIIGMIVIISVLLWSFSYIYANAHETNGFTHMEGDSGPIIGQRYCSDETSIWYQDLDGDGELDTCTRVIFTNGVVHIRRSLPIDNDCSCIIGEDI